LSRYALYSWALVCATQASLPRWRPVRLSGFFHSAYRQPFSRSASALLPPSRRAWFTCRVPPRRERRWPSGIGPGRGAKLSASPSTRPVPRSGRAISAASGFPKSVRPAVPTTWSLPQPELPLQERDPFDSVLEQKLSRQDRSQRHTGSCCESEIAFQLLLQLGHPGRAEGEVGGGEEYVNPGDQFRIDEAPHPIEESDE